MVFDKFKNWRKGAVGPTVECPLCHTLNPEGTMQCSQCMYQLGKAAFEQVASIDDTEASSLFDELLADFDEDEEEEVVDWSKGTFTMDDVTIDVEQYGKDDAIKLSGDPTFAMTVDPPDSVEEDEGDYELTAADAPAFVTKFEMPESEPELLEEVPSQQIELIQPTAESADTVEVVAADAIPDRNGSLSKTMPAAEKPAPAVEESLETAEVQAEEESETEPEVAAETQVESTEITEKSLLLLKKVELVDMAEAEGLSTSGTKAELAARIIAGPPEIEEVAEPVIEPKSETEPMPKPASQSPIVVPAAPAGMPPPPPLAVAQRVDPMDAAFDGGASPPRIPRIPKIPTMPHIAQANEALDMPVNNGFWPWPQQEEWPNREVALKIKEAMEEAKRKNVAQVMVLLDEVGPHLGDRTKLLYPIGALLQRVGRASAVDRMIAAAVEAEPDDKHVQTAKAKLRP
ncbi:TPA: hypothetical protein HA325_05040 [Candidatus Thalassarchaeaceae archaeon]|jgi:hypothetical protein|nr:hypothetical protein [Candidatus Thalassarchaeaceae archaeon]